MKDRYTMADIANIKAVIKCYTEELQGIFISLVNLNVIIRKGKNNGKN